MPLLDIENTIPVDSAHIALAEQVAWAALREEGIRENVSVHLLLTDDETIRTLNRTQRGVDRVTDVLSFPSLRLTPEKTLSSSPEKLLGEYDPDTGACFLGDIAISLPQAERQSAEYGHSLRRELAYLTVHAMLHLMGYDHILENDQRRMRQMEEKILAAEGLRRVTDEELIEKARDAMRFSYSPYSGYAVGACLACDDGSLYTGCNIENASYGASNCAERTAIFKAVSEGHRRFTAIAIAASGHLPWPCGICRQVMYEFSPDMRVLVTSGDEVRKTTLAGLLPEGFGPSGSAAEFLGRSDMEEHHD